MTDPLAQLGPLGQEYARHALAAVRVHMHNLAGEHELTRLESQALRHSEQVMLDARDRVRDLRDVCETGGGCGHCEGCETFRQLQQEVRKPQLRRRRKR